MIDYEKRIISGLLTLSIIFSMFAIILPASEIKTDAATASQLNIVARANYMYNATWVCQKTVTGWGGTFYAGSTYHVPYGQPIYSGKYVGFNGNAVDDSTIDTYLAAAADPNSIFYSGRSYYTGKQAPYYSNDCSAFVSWCWGVSRKTTASIPNVSTNLGMATASNNYNLQLGDALNSNSAGHVVLVTGLSYNEWGAITTI